MARTSDDANIPDQKFIDLENFVKNNLQYVKTYV